MDAIAQLQTQFGPYLEEWGPWLLPVIAVVLAAWVFGWAAEGDADTDTGEGGGGDGGGD